MYERRQISKKEKRKLYLMSNGRCSCCNAVLGRIWDAHHLERWIDGGKTNLNNIIAVCKQCHINIHKIKENSMTELTLRRWQENGLNEFVAHTIDNKKTFLLDATPGAGKSFFAGICAEHLFKQNKCNFIVSVVPTRNLKDSFQEAFETNFNMRLENNAKNVVGDYTVRYEYNKIPPKNFEGIVITYSQLSQPDFVDCLKVWHNNGSKLFFIFDEIHHLKDTDYGDEFAYSAWGQAAKKCEDIASKILAMTGTPFRVDEFPIPFLIYDMNPSSYFYRKCIADFSYTYREAVTENVCRDITFIIDDGEVTFLNKQGVQETHKISEIPDSRKGIASTTLFDANSDFVFNVITKANKRLNEYRETKGLENSGGIIICKAGHTDIEKNNRKIFEMAKTVKAITGEEPTVVTYDDENASDKIKAFREGKSKWILSVRMISEGVDIKRLRICVPFIQTESELLFRQILGRILRVLNNNNESEDATAYIAAFSNMVEMASRIREEAEVGVNDRIMLQKIDEEIDKECIEENKYIVNTELDNIDNEECPENEPINEEIIDNIDNNFKKVEINDIIYYIPLKSVYIEHGAITSEGEKYTAQEINNAYKFEKEFNLLGTPLPFNKIIEMSKKYYNNIPIIQSNECVKPIQVKKYTNDDLKRMKKIITDIIKTQAMISYNDNYENKKDPSKYRCNNYTKAELSEIKGKIIAKTYKMFYQSKKCSNIRDYYSNIPPEQQEQDIINLKCNPIKVVL